MTSLEFKHRLRSERQQDRSGHRDRVVLLETHLYEQLVTISLREACSLKEAASRILEAGLALYFERK